MSVFAEEYETKQVESVEKYKITEIYTHTEIDICTHIYAHTHIHTSVCMHSPPPGPTQPLPAT